MAALPSPPGPMSLIPLSLLLSCSQPTPPDVILLTWDTVRADHADATRTPWLEARSREGAVFTQARSVAPLTLPAHASMLTGRYPHEHGARANAGFPYDGQTLAHDLSAAGYRCGAFVSSAVLDERQGLAGGFEIYDDDVGTARDRYFGERPGLATVERALAWAAQQDQSAPICLWVHLFDAHAPLSLSPEQVAPWGTGYAAEVNLVDRASAALWDGLRQRARPALWVVTADHGESLGEHGEFTHGYYAYDSTLRIPFVVFGDGVRPGRFEEPVSLIDVQPTVLAAAGLPSASSGLDLGPALRGEGAVPARTLLFESVDPALSYGARPIFGSLTEAEARIDVERYALGSDPDQLQDLGAPAGEPARAWPPDAGEAARAWPSDGGEAALAQLRALGYVAGLDEGGEHAPGDLAPLMQLEQTGSADYSPGQALERLRSLVARYGESAASRALERELLRALGRLDEAIALASARGEPEADAMRQELAQAQQLEGAIRRRLAERGPDPIAHSDLGRVLWTLGRLSEAREQLALALSLGDEESRGQLVTLLVTLELPEEALALLDGLEDPASRCSAGHVALQLGRADPEGLRQCGLVGRPVGPLGLAAINAAP